MVTSGIPYQKAPVVGRRVYGRKKYNWRVCPYATTAGDHRVPTAEKTIHTSTSGAMELYLGGGHERAGFRCTDPNCSFFTGAALTSITGTTRTFTISGGEYLPYFQTYLITPCSGSHFVEY